MLWLFFYCFPLAVHIFLNLSSLSVDKEEDLYSVIHNKGWNYRSYPHTYPQNLDSSLSPHSGVTSGKLSQLSTRIG